MNTIISVNSLLFRNFFGLLACLGIFIGATLFLANNWPPVINFEWFFLPVLSLVSLTGIFCFSLWIFFPRNFKIKIDESKNQWISELMNWKNYPFDPIFHSTAKIRKILKKLKKLMKSFQIFYLENLLHQNMFSFITPISFFSNLNI